MTIKPIPITPKEIREGRAFLQKRNLRTSDIAPSDFVKMSKRLNKSFFDTLKLIAKIQMDGQGESPFSETAEALANKK